MDWQELIFKFVGGLGIFLFGIKYMSEGLQKTAGDKMRNLLATYTSNPLLGVLVGIVVTILIQTSTGTTVMAIGLINAGLMTLRQAIGVIMGANIGTTMTAFIVGIKIENYALPIIGVGAFLLFFIGKKKVQYIGQIIFGFGTLFLGLSTMGGGLKPLRDLEIFTNFMVDLSHNSILGVLVGTVFTMIVQSSSATIGILQQIADEGMISLQAALPVLFGDNIGTTITAVLASIGATVAAKRAALVHVIFNVCGTIIFTLALPIVHNVVLWLGEDVNVRMQIAYAHGLFNTANTLLFLPLIPVLAWIVTRIIPGSMQELEFKPKFLDQRLLATPSVALGQAQHEIIRMGGYARETLNDASTFFFGRDPKVANLAMQKEQLINELDRKITEYMVKIQQNGLPEGESEKASVLMQTINDIERIGDHAENIVELSEFSVTNKVDFSEDAMQNLRDMLELADKTVERALYALEHQDREAAEQVLAYEAELDRMEVMFRKGHIQRLNQNLCTGNSGAVFLDILSNLERVGDHSKNIAQYILYGE
ncbi:sodium-dependent phosphate transporter [Paenibacillus sambharensis]|uniref:Sodium-dependent phosphate transporter n=1 Tax=Paenibacillus sambharensis TaxID=1803190 RepID=A0A2W1L900_9BACL|nr:Na/Pi cotransporter family protein [Paenibacillus sambharensis]PZD95393.1 sodium-dependent phosphate transporter [Paenibacillus sambharensis]